MCAPAGGPVYISITGQVVRGHIDQRVRLPKLAHDHLSYSGFIPTFCHRQCAGNQIIFEAYKSPVKFICLLPHDAFTDQYSLLGNIVKKIKKRTFRVKPCFIISIKITNPPGILRKSNKCGCWLSGNGDSFCLLVLLLVIPSPGCFNSAQNSLQNGCCEAFRPCPVCFPVCQSCSFCWKRRNEAKWSKSDLLCGSRCMVTLQWGKMSPPELWARSAQLKPSVSQCL